MTPRKAVYTPEELKARQKQQREQYNKDSTVVINVRMLPEDKAIFAAYAEYKEMPVARMLRACAEACMRADGWTYQPEAGARAEDQAEGEEDQAGEQVQ